MIASYRDHKPVHLFQQSPHRALTFGNVETISRGMTSFLQDFRSALRSIRKTRAVTFAVLLSLSLGIGSTASVFSLVNSFLLRPLRVPETERVVRITSVTQSSHVDPITNPDFEELRKRAQSFEAITTTWGGDPIFWLATRPGLQPHLAAGAAVSGEFFSGLRAEPVLGRGFRPEEDQAPGRDAVAVISRRLWELEFGRSRDVLGKTIGINSRDFIIVGVAPPSLTPGVQPAVYVPRMMFGTLLGNDAKGPGMAEAYARLKPGVTIEQAREEVGRIGEQLEQEHPDTNRGRRFTVYTQVGLRLAESPGTARGAVLFFLIAVLVLGIACVNVANLLLSTAPARTHEAAVRVALGASRGRLLRQMLIESVLVSIAGTIAGLGIAVLVARFISSIQIVESLPVVLDIDVDARVVLFTFAVGLTSGILSGLAPALRSSRGNVNALLKSVDARMGRSGRTGIRQALVAAQMAIALIVLVASGSSYQRLGILRNMEPGFRTENVLTVSFYPTRLNETEKNRGFYKQVLERVRNLPGVRTAAAGYPLPLSTFYEETNIAIDGYSMPRDQSSLSIGSAIVNESYFETLGISIVLGRAFDTRDSKESTRVAIVNEAMRDKYWANRDPLGSRMRIVEPIGIAAGGEVQIVGVVRTSKYGVMNEQPKPFVYLPMEQHDPKLMTLFIHSDGDPAAMASIVRREVTDIDPKAPVWDIRTMSQHVRQQALVGEKLDAEVLSAVAGVGLILGVLGLYGVIAYSVSQRTHEIGIRMAIGATSGDVLRMVLRHGLRLSAAGILAGSLITLALSSFAAEIFKPVDPAAPLIYVVPLLVAVTLAACYFPARRASRVDPNIALRCE